MLIFPWRISVKLILIYKYIYNSPHQSFNVHLKHLQQLGPGFFHTGNISNGSKPFPQLQQNIHMKDTLPLAKNKWRLCRSAMRMMRFSNQRHAVTFIDNLVQPGAVITRSGLSRALTGELWGVSCGDFGENWLCYNGTALYLQKCLQVVDSIPTMIFRCRWKQRYRWLSARLQ